MSLMTLQQLVAQASVALSHATLDQSSGRVSEIPSARTLRYYTTLGILDKPAGFKGRTALYGQKHLSQIVAIKRLQAQGHSLEQIQAQLLGLTPQALEALAALPNAAANAEHATEAPAQQAPRQRDFWRQAPAELEPAPLSIPSAPSSSIQGMRLEDEVLLILQDPKRALTAQDQEAIAAAATPLIALLRARHLI